MRDILFDQNYVYAADLVALMLCIIVNILMRSTYAIKKRNIKVFKTANRFVGVAAACSMSYHWLLTRITVELVPLIYLYRMAAYISMVGAYACFFIYVKNLVEMKPQHEKIMKLSVYGASLLHSVAQILSPFLKMGFYIDENLQIHQNYYTDFFRYAYVYLSINFIILMVAYRKKFIGKMFRCICAIMVISFGIMFYQAEFLQTTYSVVSFAFPILAVLFLFHYNSYDVETGTLDQYSFRQYIEEMKGKKYSLIFLSLPGISADRLREFSKAFLRKNDSFFEDSCAFRLRDNRMVMVYQKEKNKNFLEINEVIWTEFKKARGNNDFYVVMTDEIEGLTGQEYVAFCEFVEGRMKMNTTFLCDENMVENFKKSKIIYQQLKDIHQKCDLNDSRVKVFCQPVLNTKTNEFTTAEALMRMELPEIGMVFPDQFIPVAEREDFIHTLSKIILNKTCQNIRKMEDEGYHIDRVSINFSVQELYMDCFCNDITSIIESNGIAFDKIAIELTETRNEKDFLMMKSVIEHLQEKDIKFYLDDFGTGYSNFERIIGLPIDIIKFDRSLTILASKDDQSKYMVGSFSDIFKKADYQILFEGVEDEHDEAQCIDMNAQYLQGYKYSRPIPMENLRNFLDKKVS